MTTQEEIRFWKEDMKIDMILFRSTGKSMRLFEQFFGDTLQEQMESLDRLESTAKQCRHTSGWQALRRKTEHIHELLKAMMR